MQEKKTRAYSYIRFSSKKQEKGDSLKRQREDRQRWLDRHPNVVLDDEIDLEELGVSGYFGKNLHPEYGKLGNFIKLCEDGLIPENSYLLLEHLDRFSRGDAIDVAKIFKDLVKKHGLRIVALSPSEQTIDRTNVGNTETVISIVLGFQMAHIYSRNLSKRLRKAWKTKKEKARNGERFKTVNHPAWLVQQEDGSFKADKTKVKAIKHIFDQVIAGVSQAKIVKSLNDLYPPIARGKYWSPSYVCRLLNDRRVLGEFQLHKKGENEKMIPDGKPIKDYFPRVIEESLFYEAQAKKTKHKRVAKNSQGELRNLFKSLVFCTDGYQMFFQKGHYTNRYGSYYEWERLKSYGHKLGMKDACKTTIDYPAFEELMMVALAELSDDDIAERKSRTKELEKMVDVINGLKQKIQIVENSLVDINLSPEEFESSFAIKKDLVSLLDEKEKEYSSVLSTEEVDKREVLTELKQLVKIENLKDQEQRKRYAFLIPKIIERITVNPVKFRNGKTGAIGEIFLKSGHKRVFVMNARSGLKRSIVTDQENRPYFVLCKNGVIVYESFFENQKTLSDGFSLKIKSDLDDSEKIGGIFSGLLGSLNPIESGTAFVDDTKIVRNICEVSVEFLAGIAEEDVDLTADGNQDKM
jgi:DNA invertase Pin-like site-specific DNA recombinase